MARSDLAADRRCHLVFVGELPRDPYGDMMRSRVESPASSGRVHITGFVSGEAYGLYLQAADIGVQLRAFSRGETSAAVLDCLRHGLATIVNANGSMAELPADCVLRLEDQFETTALVQALERLCNDVQERRHLGAAARAHMDEHHDPVRIAGQYREAIEDFTRRAATLHNLPMLVEHARQLMSAGRSDDEDVLLRDVAAIREEGGEQQPVQRLFVDVLGACREDLRTGIQRVVRALLLQLLHAPPPGYRVEPVWLGDGEGRWRYYHARAYTMQLLGLDPGLWPDAPIELAKGDIFLGADFSGRGDAGERRWPLRRVACPGRADRVYSLRRAPRCVARVLPSRFGSDPPRLASSGRRQGGRPRVYLRLGGGGDEEMACFECG